MDQKCLIWVFLGKNWKYHCHISNQHPQICQIGKVSDKPKSPNLRPKIFLFGYFLARILKKYRDI